MATYIVTKGCNYGVVGELVDIDKPLTERQKVMLKPYEPPKKPAKAKKSN